MNTGPQQHRRESALLCGACMNSAEFAARVIVPRVGNCDDCDRRGTVWELWGVLASQHKLSTKADAP